MSITREHLAGLSYARSIIEENWPAEALLEIVDNCIDQAKSAPEPVLGEAVEVVAWLETKGRYTGQVFLTEVDGSAALMTVAQHQKIVAVANHGAELVELLRDENSILRAGMKGDYDLDAWLEWVKEKSAMLRQEAALLKDARRQLYQAYISREDEQELKAMIDRIDARLIQCRRS